MSEKRVIIGTSGYSYADWRGIFYPPELNSAGYLQYYATRFSFLELNFSYYRQPEVSMLRRMAENTPADFRFAIKAHRSLTHDRRPDWPQSAERYREGIEPLIAAGKLAGILFQFPNSFHRTRDNRRYLGRLTESFAELPLFIEFRNAEWFCSEVYSSLTERGLGLVNTDNPPLDTLPPSTEKITGSAGYVRFHGRNKENWWRGDNVSRYDYLYTEEQLREWVPRIQRMLEKVAILYLAFNNHHKGQAVANALQLISLLQEPETR